MGTRLVTIQTHADTSSQHMCMHVHTVEPPLTTTSKEQPHAIKRPRTQVWIA